MNGLHAHNTRDPIRPQLHRLAQDHPTVHTAYEVELQKAILSSSGDDEAYLVHMGAQEQLISSGSLPLLEYNQIAQSVDANGVGIGFRLLPKILPHFVLVPGYPVHGTQGL